MKPEISILIITKGRQDLFPRTVDSVVKNMRGKHTFEIVVLDETENPSHRTFPEEVRYVTMPVRERGFGYARNCACRMARGELIAFLDDDVLLAPDWAEEIFKPFSNPRVGAVGGAVLPQVEEINSIGCVVSLLGFPAGGVERMLHSGGRCRATALISTGNCAFRAEAYREAGGFDELLRWGGEDQEFFSRVSERFETLFVPRAVVYHRQRDDLKEIFRWFMRRGKAEFFRRCKQHPSPASLFLPLRSNFSLKLMAGMGLAALAFLHSIAALVVFSLLTLSAGFAWTLCRRSRLQRLLADADGLVGTALLARRLARPAAWCLLWPLKLWMDLGFEVGRLLGICCFWRNRLFRKPVILSLHHLGAPPPGSGQEELRYYLPVEDFEKIVEDCIRDGRAFISAGEIMRRMKECPNSLYFEPLVSLTFDDAYRSILKPLKGLLVREVLRPTVFVPAGLAGRSNQWDRETGWKEAAVMDWSELGELAALGAEIGAHGISHSRLTALSTEAAWREISGALSEVASRVHGSTPIGIPFSYPHGALDREIRQLVERCGFIGAVANHGGSVRPRMDRFELPRYAIAPGVCWKTIARCSRSQWIRDLMKDLRDRVRLAEGRIRP